MRLERPYVSLRHTVSQATVWFLGASEGTLLLFVRHKVCSG